jgi:protein-tyrosine phosphatase
MDPRIMPYVVDWRSAPDLRPIVQRAVQALAEGQVVAFPTETTYTLAASVLIPNAVERLLRTKKSPQGPLTLGVRGACGALDWVPQMSPLGRRLARRLWPGPVTLVFGQAVEHGRMRELTESVREQVCPSGSLRLRMPAHQAPLSVMQLFSDPLVLSSAHPLESPPATTAQAVVETLGDGVDLIIDDGPTRLAQPSTVVSVEGNSWSVLREGPITAEQVAQQTTCLVIFVCTGNTCRSPLAEVLFKKRLAERLGCEVNELVNRGFLVISAGLAAMMGGPAAEEAVEVARSLGADLAGHRSRPLTPHLAAQADFLVAMTRSHQLALVEGFPELGTTPRLLSPCGTDVADPIGSELPVYRECAEQIESYLDDLLAGVVN